MNLFRKFFSKKTPPQLYDINIPKITKSKVAVALVSRDEIEVIEDNIKFHLAQGVDLIFATDNNSADGTLDIFKKYEKLGKLILFQDSSNMHDQSRIINNMIKVAKEEYKIDWVFTIDSDELLLSKWGNLKRNITQIENSGYNVAFVPMFNIYPETLKDTEQTFWLNTKGYFQYRHNDPTMFFSKAIVKTKDHVDIVFGNHQTTTIDKNATVCTDITLFHYPMRTLEQYKNKMKNLANSANHTDKHYIDIGKKCLETYNNIEKVWSERIIENRKDDLTLWIKNSAAKDFIENGYRNNLSLMTTHVEELKKI